MEKETSQKLWEDFLEFTDKYAGENSGKLYGVILMFVAHEIFHHAPNREEATILIQNSVQTAWEWYQAEQKERE